MRIDEAGQRLIGCTLSSGIDFPITNREAYFANLYQDHELTLQGQILCEAVDLTPGVNLRGHAKPAVGLSCYSWLNALGADKVTAIQGFDRTTDRFETCAFEMGDAVQVPKGTDFPIAPGAGYLLNAVSAGSLTLPGCEQ